MQNVIQNIWIIPVNIHGFNLPQTEEDCQAKLRRKILLDAVYKRHIKDTQVESQTKHYRKSTDQ